MRDFDYVAPVSLAEAVTAFAGTNGAARALAGGTDLIDQVRTGRRTPSLVVDMKRIPELTALDYTPAGGLRIGAATSCARVQAHPEARARYPGVAQAAGLVGSIQVQNRASLGGNIGNAAPSADTVPCLIALNARVTIAGPRGMREEPLEGVFAGPGQLTLAPEEFLVEIRVPPPAPRSTTRYLRFIPRAEMDIAVVGVGVMLALTDGHRVADVGIVLAAVAPTPVRAREAEALMRGQPLSQALLRAAGERAVEAARPITDLRGSADYRRELVKVLTQRALAAAVEALGARAG